MQLEATYQKEIEDSIARVKSALFGFDDKVELNVEDLDKILAEYYALRWRFEHVKALLAESNAAISRYTF